LTTSEVNDASWRAHPWTYRNNRGCAKTKDGFIRYGIPEPNPHKQEDGKFRESNDDKKGGDRIGWSEVVITPEMVGKTIAVFTNIEVKGDGDVLIAGQIRWHNFVLEHGGISEIWHGDGSVINKEIEI